jgi:hypothetical protein
VTNPNPPAPGEAEKPKPYEDADKEGAYQNFAEFLKRYSAENAPPPEKTAKPEGPEKKTTILDTIIGFGK